MVKNAFITLIKQLKLEQKIENNKLFLISQNNNVYDFACFITFLSLFAEEINILNYMLNNKKAKNPDYAQDLKINVEKKRLSLNFYNEFVFRYTFNNKKIMIIDMKTEDIKTITTKHYMKIMNDLGKLLEQMDYQRFVVSLKEFFDGTKRRKKDI